MKRNIIFAIGMAMLPLAVVSCTREELPSEFSEGDVRPLSITVTDGGYAAADGQTKATENAYRTEFTAGDKCGLYIVRGGTVVYNNVKLTATADAGGSLTWQPEAGTELCGGLDDETYFLYYPYQTGMTGKVDVTATDAEGFFAPLVSLWQPEADQSTYANYTASDLMTANGTATNGTDGSLKLSFSMTHRMAMAVIEMPTTVYKFTNTDVTIPDYTVASSADFTSSAVRPFCIAPGTYRCIFNPTSSTATSITGSYDNGKKEFTVTPNGIAASSYKTYKVDGAQTVQKNHNLQVGDYLLADGSLVGKGETLTAGQQAACIGIVFHAGQHSNDQSDYTGSGIGQKNCHGYVVSLSDATSQWCMWGNGNGNTELGSCPTDIDGNRLDNVSNPDIDWSGYNWTQTIIAAAGGKNSLNATDRYPATYYAVVAYENKAPSPTKSSGWFLPSIGQMNKVYQQQYLFGSVVGSSGLKNDDYWSSSEDWRMPDRAVLAMSIYHRGTVNFWFKNNQNCYATAVLAF